MKRVVAVAAALLGGLLAVAPLQAQTGAVRGKVVDEEGNGVPEAKVLIEAKGSSRKYQVKTNKKGEWAQVGLPSGSYNLSASKDDMTSPVGEIRVTLGDPADLSPIVLQKPRMVRRETGPEGTASAPTTGTPTLQEAFQKANVLTAEKKWDEAIAAYKAIAAESPGPEVYQNLGYVYTQKGDNAGAEESYAKVVELKPSAADVAAVLSKLYAQSGRLDKAVATMEKAAADNPTNAPAQFNSGIFLLNANQPDKAQAAFLKALEIDPAMHEAHYHLGTILVGQNKINESVAELEKYLATSPENQQFVATAQGLIAALKPAKK
jgi:Flp pilus assembly protein TadD